MSNDISIIFLQKQSFWLLTIKVMELQLALCLNEWASYLKIIRTKGEKSQGSLGNIFRVKDYYIYYDNPTHLQTQFNPTQSQVGVTW